MSMRAWAVAALDLVFPALCPVCATPLGAGRHDPLCGGCWDAIERVRPPVCDVCGLPFLVLDRTRGDAAGGRCGECAVAAPDATKLMAIVMLRDLIITFGG